MPEFTEGTQTVYHDDGSSTTYTVEHMPHVEPLTMKETLLWSGIGLGLGSLLVGTPLGIEMWVERHMEKRKLKDRQKMNREVFFKMKNI